MNNLKYLIHYAGSKEDYESIMKDGYLKFILEKCQCFCEGIYTQAVFDDMPFLGFLSPYPIYINKSILNNRKDYIIKEAYLGEGVTKHENKKQMGEYGGNTVFIRRKYKNAKLAERKLEKVLNDLTMTNEVIFTKSILIKKYMIKNPKPFVKYGKK